MTRRADQLGMDAVADWCGGLDRRALPRKSLQDCLDSVICLLVAASWLGDRERCLMIVDLAHGYIVAPVGPDIRAMLDASAGKHDVANA